MTTADRYDTFGPRFLAGIVDSFVFLPFGIVDYYMTSSTPSTLVLLLWGTLSYSVTVVVRDATQSGAAGERPRLQAAQR